MSLLTEDFSNVGLEEGELPQSTQNMGLHMVEEVENNWGKEHMLAMIKENRERIEHIELVLGLRMDGEKSHQRNVSRDDMLNMVKEAISFGNDSLGVSKKLIRKHLFVHCGLPDTPHYTRKLNAVIQCGLDRKMFRYDSVHQMFNNI